MVDPRPSVTRFVRAVVRVEIAHGGGAQDPDVARRIIERLHQDLVKVIGPAGFDVLLARSLVLARRAHPALAAVTPGPGGVLAGLDEAARDGVALQEGVMAIVSRFIELLVVLIGEDLAMRLVRDGWPAAAEEEKK
jgi:hypothetical protein